MGKEDYRLLDIINHLESLGRRGGGNARISEREKNTLSLAWARLDFLTCPGVRRSYRPHVAKRPKAFHQRLQRVDEEGVRQVGRGRPWKAT